MEPERWRRLETLLHAALERPAAERPEFLAHACGLDAALLRQATDLLRADRDAGDFLGRPLLDETAVAGRQIGPYRLERKLGEGGMSAVYLAHRDDEQYRRRVAVKVVRFGMDGEEHLRRFRAERQILAHLDHPDIARLYDGGTTDDGLPYLAMELVEGETIDVYCDRRRLDVRARLELFSRVCTAVGYAHRNLVVHRDLKPSNVLVGADGSPKLLDFGIAKLLDPAMAPPGTQPTQTWQRLMTPDYASPEQVRGEPVTTASDVYSLGVLLFELLTGRRPYRRTGLSPRQIEEQLEAHRPPKPSQAIRPAADANDPAAPAVAAASARQRGESRPQRLRRRLAGDLDNIVGQALHADPQRRYGSAEQLADDVRRHLAGEPVSAHPDSLAYRAGKFLRRHRVGVGFAALLALLVSTATILLAFQSARLAEERNQAQAERDKAREVAALLEGIFSVSDPWTVGERAPSAKALLDRTAEELRATDALSEAQAALMNSMGRIYRHHGELDLAEELMSRALAARTRLLGPDHPEIAVSLSDLGMLNSDRGAHADAVRQLERALEIRTRHFGEPSLEVAQSASELAILLSASGEYERAEALDRRALSQLARLADPPVWLASQVRLNLGQILYAGARYEEAAEVTRVAWEGLHEELGEAHPGAVGARNVLAAIHLAQGDLEAAAEGFEETLRLYRKSLGDDSPKVAVALGNLAMVESLLDRHEQAISLQREALELRRRTFGDEHPAIAANLNGLAGTLRRGGELAQAESVQRQALEMRQATLGDEHPHVARDLSHLGWILLERDRLAEAEPLLREALRRRRELLSEDHPSLADTLVPLGRLLARRGDPAGAERLLREAVDIRRRRLSPGHWQTADAEAALADLLARTDSSHDTSPRLARR